MGFAPLTTGGRLVRPVATQLLLVALVITLLTGTSRAATPASPDLQPGEPDTRVTQLEIMAQTPLVPPDGTFTVQVDPGSVDLAGLEAVVTVYRILESEAELDAEPAQTLNRVNLGLAENLVGTTSSLLEIELPIRNGQPIDDLDRVRLPDPGVYPVIIDLRDGNGPVAAARTELIRLPTPGSPPAAPQPVALMLGMGSTSPPNDTGDTADTGALDVRGLIDLLDQFPTMPLTVMLNAATIVELQADTDLARSLSGALAGRPVLAAVDPALDPSALAAIGQEALYREAVASTAQSLTRLGLAPAPATVVIEAPLTERGAAVLRELGSGIALDLSATGGGSGVLTSPAGPVHVVEPAFTSTAAPEGRGPAAPTAGDPTASGALDSSGDRSEVWVHQLLARLMLRRQAGIDTFILGVPARIPTGEIDTLLAALAGAGLFVPALIDQVAPAAATGELAPAARPTQNLSAAAEPLGTALDRLATYGSFYVDGPDSPTQYRLRLSRSLDLDASPNDPIDTIAAIDQQLARELEVVSLPENQSVTLAARSASIPLTITNGSTGTRDVLLRFRSDKFVVAEDGQVITVGPGTSSIDVQVEARSLGVSPLEVTALTPDGRQELAATRFEIRSTAVPGLGLALSALGLVLLAIWWYLSIRRRRSAHPSRSDWPGGSGSGSPADQDSTPAGDSV